VLSYRLNGSHSANEFRERNKVCNISIRHIICDFSEWGKRESHCVLEINKLVRVKDRTDTDWKSLEEGPERK